MADKNTAGAAGRAPRGRPARQDPQRRAGGPVRIGQDDARRAAPRGCRALSRAPAASRTARPSPTSTRPSCASSAPSASPSRRSVVDGVKVNLIDTPGYADFVGDLRAGLRAADAALFVVSAADGVDGSTQLLWEECAAVGMPRAVVVTKLDKERSDFDDGGDLPARLRRAASCRSTCRCTPTTARSPGSSVCCRSRSSTTPAASASPRRPTPSTSRSSRAPAGTLIEGIIAESEDETLMERYLGGEELDVDILIADLETAVARGSFYPVLASAPRPRSASAPPRSSSSSCAGSRRRSSTRCPR